ncbi:hypothetical protein Pcinc_020203 [Petrolisthes cinctipes]|uniref:CCHC-type domain-containing protein n=1 Tax=Petrolisthes cinctipes TaxID=88211 RepID=A0AAE1KJC5_PETCI|nr:hypothetical protein Pcinc_020203 [Petrolisthes cinctipes]
MIYRASQVVTSRNLPTVGRASSDSSLNKTWNYQNRIFAGEICGQKYAPVPVSVVKSEPVLWNENIGGEELLYVRGNQRGRAPVRGGAVRDRGHSSGRYSRYSTGSARSYTRSSTGRRQNPLGPDGKVSSCLVCNSRFHWARDCPDAYENLGSRKDHSETVHLSLFMGYAGDASSGGKLQKLVEESKGCAVLDTGCSTTVCGQEWMKYYISELSDHERENVTEEKSSSTFTFADGVTISSVKRVTLPCHIGNMCSTIVTDVVDCNIPLLLSKRSMKKAKMVMNFETDQVKICGNIIDLKSSSSGHYLLPISL